MAGGGNIIIAVVATDNQPARNAGYLKTLFCATLRFLHGFFQREPTENPPIQLRNPFRDLPVHPVMVTIREQELGKILFNLGAPITIALLITNDGKSRTVLGHFVLTGLSVGCAAIWHGIAFRAISPQAAAVMEQSGIIMVLMSFNGLVASALPIEFAWVPILCGGLCVLPFVIADLPRQGAVVGD